MQSGDGVRGEVVNSEGGVIEESQGSAGFQVGTDFSEYVSTERRVQYPE